LPARLFEVEVVEPLLVPQLFFKLQLEEADPSDPRSIIARAQTLTTLGRLDSKRKRSVVQFLFEAGLIYNRYRPQEVRGHLVVSLRGLI